MQEGRALPEKMMMNGSSAEPSDSPGFSVWRQRLGVVLEPEFEVQEPASANASKAETEAHGTELVCVGRDCCFLKLRGEVRGGWDLGVLINKRCVLLSLPEGRE